MLHCDKTQNWATDKRKGLQNQLEFQYYSSEEVSNTEYPLVFFQYAGTTSHEMICTDQFVLSFSENRKSLIGFLLVSLSGEDCKNNIEGTSVIVSISQDFIFLLLFS